MQDECVPQGDENPCGTLEAPGNAQKFRNFEPFLKMYEVETFIYFLGMKIYEPVTILTSLVMTALSYSYFARIKKDPAKKHINSWKYFFLFLGTSSLLGSVAHGAHEQLGQAFYNTFKSSGNICSLLSSFFWFRGTLLYTSKDHQLISRISKVVTAWIVLVIAVTIVFNHFVVIMINSALFICYILVAHFIAWRKGRPGNGSIVAAFGIAVLSILIFALKISPHEFFNYKDLPHVLMWVSLALLYRGIRSMTGSGGSVEKMQNVFSYP